MPASIRRQSNGLSKPASWRRKGEKARNDKKGPSRKRSKRSSGEETSMPKSVKWAVGLLALLWSCASVAQTYPTKPVRIIVPYQAGQGTDVVARYLAEHLSRTLGQRFYVENKPGAGGNIGTEQAAHSDADGYTLLMGTNATQAM